MEWKVVRTYSEYIYILKSQFHMRLHPQNNLTLKLFFVDLHLKLLLVKLLLFKLRQHYLLTIGGLFVIILENISGLLILGFSWPSFINIFVTLFGSLLGFYFGDPSAVSLFLRRNKQAFNSYKLETIFPEEWRADFKILQERWIKQNYSYQRIKFLTIKHIFHMFLGYIKIWIDNMWLPKNASTKEIE